MVKKSPNNASNEEVDTKGVRCCEHRQDAGQSFRLMLEGPQPDHMRWRECEEQLCHNPPMTQPTSPTKRRAPHLCSSLMHNLASSTLEATIGSCGSTPYQGGEQSRPATCITTSTMEAADNVAQGLGPSRRSTPSRTTARDLHQTTTDATTPHLANPHEGITRSVRQRPEATTKAMDLPPNTGDHPRQVPAPPASRATGVTSTADHL
jgi:hypothetical protein